ncbi:hypothetical protein PtrEW4_011267, partial [Pyrenophora tritici-repentis]
AAHYANPRIARTDTVLSLFLSRNFTIAGPLNSVKKRKNARVVNDNDNFNFASPPSSKRQQRASIAPLSPAPVPAFKPSSSKSDVSAAKAVLSSNKYSVAAAKEPIDPPLCAYCYLDRVNCASLSLEDRTCYTYKANKVACVALLVLVKRAILTVRLLKDSEVASKRIVVASLGSAA